MQKPNSFGEKELHVVKCQVFTKDLEAVAGCKSKNIGPLHLRCLPRTAMARLLASFALQCSLACTPHTVRNKRNKRIGTLRRQKFKQHIAGIRDVGPAFFGPKNSAMVQDGKSADT